jgi:hypothetical protein
VLGAAPKTSWTFDRRREGVSPKMKMTVGQPIQIKGMAYAPVNEQGVVLLFGRLAPRLGFHVEGVQTAFPDCIARRHGKSCRIEFEFRASSYRKHPPRGADVIVCWDNDWDPPPPEFKHLEIISLKKYVGAYPRVFALSCKETERGAFLDEYSEVGWSVPGTAQVGDLIVMYRTRPASAIRDLWTIKGPFYTDKRWGLLADLKLLLRLENPITFKELRTDRVTRELSVVRRQFQGKGEITDDWLHIAAKIVQRNPGARKVLRQFDVD